LWQDFNAFRGYELDGKLLTPYTDPERHNTLCHRQTDGQTDDSIVTIAADYDRLILLSIMEVLSNSRDQLLFTKSLGL